MSRPRYSAVGLLAMLALGCRSAEPTPRTADPSAEEQARALVEQARRDIETGAENGAENGAGRGAAAAADSSQRLHVPSGGGNRLPLLVFLHGLGGSGGDLTAGLRLDEMAESLGFAFLAPDGVLDHSGRRFWNASESCCNFDRLEVDHVQLLRDWITRAVSNPRVDPERVYIVGFSNGGFMAYRAACELGTLLRGVVSIAGAGPGEAARCQKEKKLDVVQIHGDRDPIVKFDGGHLFTDSRRPRHPSAEASLAYWAKLDGCTGELAPVRDLDLDPRVPGAETRVSSYGSCGERRVELWRIVGGDHSAGLSRLSLAAIWDFIQSAPAAPAAP
jgi:polyhydroxybutyrate depolymerase